MRQDRFHDARESESGPLRTAGSIWPASISDGLLALVAVAWMLVAGCAAPANKSAQQTMTPLSQRKVTATVVTNAAPTAPEPPLKARVLPLTARIAAVNEKLRYVIVDFTNSRQPAIDERLGVYRVGEKVAEIKISGPYRNTTVAADIVSGEVKYGDEVKTD